MHNEDCLDLLRKLVHAPSPSFNEEAVAAWISWWFDRNELPFRRPQGNIVACASTPDPAKKTLALIAHLDTVPPAAGYTRDPYDAGDSPDIIWGLGANDDGGSVVSMLAVLRHYYGKTLPFNLLLLLVREEECSGPDGLRWLYGPEGPFAQKPDSPLWLPTPDWAIVGDEEALDDIARLRGHRFPRVSPEMGEVRLNVTQILSGTAHNVIPDRCRFVVDIRPNELYTPLEILEELQTLCQSRLSARNLLHRASATATDSPLRRAVAELGIDTFSSPTSSDWMQLPCDAIKMGPGDSARSHRADEYIRTAEIEAAITQYINFIENLSASL